MERRDAAMKNMTVTARVGRQRCAIGVIVAAATLISCCVHPSCARAQDQQSSTPDSGRIWYEKYCAECHGVGGAPGKAVFVTSKQPVDLRTYVQRHGGKFPKADWLRIVLHEPPGNPHTATWQRIFRDESGRTGSEAAARTKINQIADYVLSIQAKAGAEGERPAH